MEFTACSIPLRGALKSFTVYDAHCYFAFIVIDVTKMVTHRIFNIKFNIIVLD